MDPQVSIVILNYNHPEVIEVSLRSISNTAGIDYEVVVVDNGSEDECVEALRAFKEEGLITTLIENKENKFFSEGNNIGVRNTNQLSKYILILNSDVAFIRPDWLTKMVAWMEGTIEYAPSVWGFRPTRPNPGPRDIVSYGWAYDPNLIPSMARPEGFCCMLRRSVWREISQDFPWYYGFEEMIANTVRDGAKCGVLGLYQNYMVHREGGSGGPPPDLMTNTNRPVDMAGWYRGLYIETLDFTLGPDERLTYLSW